MRFQPLWKVLVAGLGCGLIAAACSAPDPGALVISDKTPHVGASGGTSGGTSGTSGQTSSGTSGQTSSGASGASGGTDSGTSGGHDAGPDTSGPIVPDAFKGAPAYVSTPGQAATNANHGTADNLPPNHNCFDCHKNGGPGNEMTIGGWVKNAAGNGANRVEVRVVDKAGVEIAKAYTEANGYFYILGTALGTGPYRVGVRNANVATGMVADLAAGGCGTGNTCHGGTAGDIHIP